MSALGDRGQAHTLEGIVATLVLLSAVIFALEMTVVTPLSASTSSQHLENQQRSTADGILGAASDSGALEEAVLYWNQTSRRFHNATRTEYYTNGPPDNEFGRMLERSFDDRSIAYNVYLTYFNASDGRQTRKLIDQGVPSDNAVRASRMTVLLDGDRLRDADGSKNETLAVAGNFYANDVRGSSVYNVVRVEVVVWRI